MGSAMDHSLTRSPSSTPHDAYVGTERSSTEPPQMQINVKENSNGREREMEREQERRSEKTLRDVSRVLSLTQHRDEDIRKRSTHVNAQSGHNHNEVAPSPAFEAPLALHNEDSNMTAQTVVSEDVVSVHGLLKM